MMQTEDQRIDESVNVIFLLARKISSETVADIMVHYAGHVQALEVYGFTGGYSEGAVFDYRSDMIYLNSPKALAELNNIREILVVLYQNLIEPERQRVVS